jgi:hypothetical protein
MDVEVFKTMKEESAKYGYELQMSIKDFKKNHNKISVKSTLTPKQFVTEAIFAYDIVKKGNNFVQNAYFRNPANELVIAPMVWVEKMQIVRTDRIDCENGLKKFPFPIRSITIPQEVEELYSKRETCVFFEL